MENQKEESQILKDLLIIKRNLKRLNSQLALFISVVLNTDEDVEEQDIDSLRRKLAPKKISHIRNDYIG